MTNEKRNDKKSDAGKGRYRGKGTTERKREGNERKEEKNKKPSVVGRRGDSSGSRRGQTGWFKGCASDELTGGSFEQRVETAGKSTDSSPCL